MPDFNGLKLSVDRKCQERPWGIHRVDLNKNDDRLELLRPGRVGWSGNSGFHSFNLAIQLGVKKILLVGFDMTLSHGLHWHGPHKQGLNNPTDRSVARWRRVLDAASPLVDAMGIKVFNTSKISALQNYRKVPFLEALEC